MISVKKTLRKLCPVWVSVGERVGIVKLCNLLIQWGYSTVELDREFTSQGLKGYSGSTNITFEENYANAPAVMVHTDSPSTAMTTPWGSQIFAITADGFTMRISALATSSVTRIGRWIAIGKAASVVGGTPTTN